MDGGKDLKVLFIGGTGIISSACSELAIKKGIDLYHLNRGASVKVRPVIGVKTIKADIRDPEATQLALSDYHFDAVVEWIGFVPEHIQTDIELFRNKTKQYIFISSSAAYQTPPEKLPVTEETPLENPFWEYARNKIACENVLQKEYELSGFPYTVVRPSHTYDKTLIPLMGGYTTLARMKQGLPVIVHGDGASIWTLTHHTDFAKGLVGLLGKVEAIGQAYHITSDEWLSWESIFLKLARAMGVSPKLVHIPSDIIASYDKEIGDGLVGDKTHSMIFDNAKIKALVPEFRAEITFDQGAQEIVDWYEFNPERQIVDKRINALMDKMIAEYR